jgi:outer membrane protein assembly factor BamB
VIEAPHGGNITELAVTADGTAAISADELGGIRIWPKLDGSIEPREVELAHPRQLALARDPRGFLIAMVDDVGGLVLQVIDRDGLTLQRAVLGPEPGFAGVVMTDRGPLAWKRDHRVVRVAADGSVRADLPAGAGQRILAVTVAGPRAVAVIESSDPSTGNPVRRARWLTIGDKLAWGGWIDGTDDITTAIALSPSGKLLASLVGAQLGGLIRVIVIDTATGTLVANEPAPGTLGIGFADDDHVAVGSTGSVGWIDLANVKPRPQSPTPVALPSHGTAQAGTAQADPAQALLATGGGRAITVNNGELLIATRTSTEFLGYALQTPAVAAGAPEGRVLIALGDTLALLDRQLHATTAPDLAIPPASTLGALVWLAGNEWLVETSRVNDGVTQVALVDVASHKTLPVRSKLPIVQQLRHDRSTQLVTLSFGDAPEVLHHEPGQLRLDHVATLPKGVGFERAQLVPVTPALAGGTQLVVVQTRDRLALRWVRDARALDQGTAITIDGSIAGVDAAAHVFVWQNDPQGVLELAVFADGKQIGKLPTDGPVALWPDPQGTQLVLVSQRSVALVALDGTRRWLKPLQGVSEALWLDDGTLAIVSLAGIARLDPRTGDLIAARCGWKFGLARTQHPIPAHFEPICTQLR